MAELLRTPLFNLHTELGAKVVPFAGYEMPVQYPLGVMKEHIHTRTHAGLFDVSHMGQVTITAKSGNPADAALALEKLIPVDILGLGEMRQRYGFFTNDEGGILDDLMVTNMGDRFFLVVNGACKVADIAHMRAHLSGNCEIEVHEDRALLALQGPSSEAALATLAPAVVNMVFMDVATVNLLGTDCIVSRSGYTGEDGFEISVPANMAEELARALLAHDAVEAIGLGARDSLRLEAGLCLYGNDLDPTTTPIEAGLIWAIQKARRTGGDRAGGFAGAAKILDQIENSTNRKRVGLRPDGRAPMRDGTPLFANADSVDQIGVVTSGGFGPTIQGPMSMAYVQSDFSGSDTRIFAEVRGKRMPATITKMPFTPANFKR